ncbi:MAG: (2Fe-2S)-binding protein [Deltaproteobacteria bacterium]|nr:(2Fe-2S)-binding protein [Deltaproteobacteria bacterium]
MEREDLIICRCEEVTQKEILRAIQDGARSLNDIKRISRAGMGLCQGRTCHRLVSQLLESRSALPLGESLKPPTFRPPLRPIKLADLALEESG